VHDGYLFSALKQRVCLSVRGGRASILNGGQKVKDVRLEGIYTPMRNKTVHIMEVLERNLRSIWDGDVDAYRETTSENLSFFEWYISPQRIDGLDFHLRELRVHKDVMSGGRTEGGGVEHEILQPRIQDFGATVVVTYTLLIRAVNESGVVHKSHNETRVFHDFGTADAPQWKLVHCHKSPIVTAESLAVLRK
jgi:hypothetical protein